MIAKGASEVCELMFYGVGLRFRSVGFRAYSPENEFHEVSELVMISLSPAPSNAHPKRLNQPPRPYTQVLLL